MQSLDNENDTALGLLLNDDLLVSLARSQPKRLMRGEGYGAEATLVTWEEFLSRLQQETRLDFSDAREQKSRGLREKVSDSMTSVGKECIGAI